MTDETPAQPQKRRRALILGTATVGALMISALMALARISLVSDDVRTESGPEAPEFRDGVLRLSGAQWASIRTAPVEERVFHTQHSADGRIAFNDDRATPVFSPFSGRVVRLLARPGDVVKAGDPLFVIQANEFIQGQSDFIAALAAAGKARKQLELARGVERRQRELYRARAGALKDWEQAQTDLIGAENDARSAETAVAAVRNRLKVLGKSDDEIRAFEAGAPLGAEASVNAPIPGTIIQRKIGAGQYIQAGASDPQFTIGDLSTVWFVANVRETDAPLMRAGEPVDVRLLAWPGKAFTARITYVAPSVDPATHRLPVRAEVDNRDGTLKPEMFASFTIASDEDVSAPAIPQSAIIYEGDRTHVWTTLEGGGVASRSIRIGRARDGVVEVLDGLRPGEKVVTAGALFVDRAAQTAAESSATVETPKI